MEFGFKRKVHRQYINLDKMADDGVIDRKIEGSPSGYYPVIVVPENLTDKLVMIIPIGEDGVPLTVKDMLKNG